MSKKQWDALWINAKIVTGIPGSQIIDQGAVAVKSGLIAWVGATKELTMAASALAENVYDVSGCCLTPGLIDCHTHLVYGGNRANEFEQRLHGATYEDIARQGGGIQSTVAATRAASEDQLFDQSMKRVRALMASGVTTMEIKSGYGLDLATELKMLRVAKRIGEALPVTIKKTFLGAHTVPAEFRDRANDYLDLVCNEMIPQVAENKLADAVDVFCENIAFSLAQTERVFQVAKQYQLAVKCHGEQLSDSGSAQLAARYHAQSVDHLEYVSEAGVRALAEAGTVAVLLPGAFYFLREKQLPPIALLRKYGVPMAVASDCNPGTSPMLSLLLMMNFACTLYRLTPEEALSAVTFNAARALGMGDVCGAVAVGMAADLVVWEVGSPVELAYYAGSSPVAQLVKGGVVVAV